MKDPALWELDDLNELIRSQAEESITLEFKRADTLEGLDNRQLADKRKDEISKDVSAFANRTGGVIVYGIEEDGAEPHPARALSPINPAKCSKERLEQIIASRIKPAIQNLVIRPVKVSADGYAYVVKIPASHTAHQASDKRYYRRGNFGNDAMADDEIRLAMHRQTKPTYTVQLAARLLRANSTGLCFTGTVENTSVMVGHEISTVLLVPTQQLGSRTETINGQKYLMVMPENGRLIDQLKPFAMFQVIFEGTYEIPASLKQLLKVPLYVRLYDQFGYAHGAEFEVSLLPASYGKIWESQQLGRDVIL
jgi:hypothetical protein